MKFLASNVNFSSSSLDLPSSRRRIQRRSQREVFL